MNREIEARLKISAIDRTGQVLSRLGQRLETVGKKTDQLNQRMSSFSKLGGLIAGYVTFDRVAQGIKDVVVDFAALERQMDRIGITADASAEQTKAAFAGVQKITKDLALPLDEGIKTLDTLVSSGKSLEEAMAFLPSVLATTQATGAAGEDIANTAIKVADALKIRNSELQHSFDIMVTGGKAGQFELKDMAQYIPSLANSFATLGYKGEDGLKQLIAILQTLREDTGDASSAATNAANIFGKMYSAETATKFKKFGIDLRKEMDAAKKSGEDAVSAFVRISKEALKGDLSKLPLLFSDQQFREGMQSLITSPESLKKFMDILNSSKVNGTVFRDVNRVLGDTQSKIDQLSSSWATLKLQLGEKAAGIIAPRMQALTKNLDDKQAADVGMEKMGWSTDRSLYWNTMDEFAKRYKDAKIQTGRYDISTVQMDALAALGRGEVGNIYEYIDREILRVDANGKLRQNYGQYRPGKGPVNPLAASPAAYSLDNPPIPMPRPGAKDLARERLAAAYRLGGDLGRSSIPQAIETMNSTESARVRKLDAFYGETGDMAAIKAHMARKKRVLQGDQADAGGIDTSQISSSLEAGGKKISDGGDEAGKALVMAAQEAGRILNAAIAQAAAALANIKVSVPGATGQKVNANTGKTNTFVNSPATLGHQ